VVGGLCQQIPWSIVPPILRFTAPRNTCQVSSRSFMRGMLSSSMQELKQRQLGQSSAPSFLYFRPIG
jgi:hypothetical protein